ncbi:hypothetical protein HDU99_008237, partial [Rhizoclosmatium hyalinum]
QIAVTVSSPKFRSWVEKYEKNSTAFFSGNRTSASKTLSRLKDLAFVFEKDFGGSVASWNAFFSVENKDLFKDIDVNRDELSRLFLEATSNPIANENDVISCTAALDDFGKLRAVEILSPANGRKKARTI